MLPLSAFNIKLFIILAENTVIDLSCKVSVSALTGYGKFHAAERLCSPPEQSDLFRLILFERIDFLQNP